MEPKDTYHHESKVFEMLEHWQPVDVPEYFETRILAKLESAKSPRLIRWGWATLVALLLLNGFAATRYIRQNKSRNEATYKQYLESVPEIDNYYPLQS